MRTFRVKNYERFQHYKDRAPPWIKLYNELLDDYEFGSLPDASKMHLIAIWLLASRSDNKIPFDPKWVARRINANDPVNLDLLLDRGFILLDQELPGEEQDASTPQAECLSREEGQVQDIKQTEQIAVAGAPRARAVEKKSRKGNATALPDGYSLPGAIEAYGIELGLSKSEIAREHQRFCNHAKQNDRRCVDWLSAEKNWLIGSAEKLGRLPPVSSSSGAVVDGLIEVLGEDELNAWDAYGRQKTGKSFPRNSRGGWRFPSRWPPGYVPPERSHEIPPPNLRSMQ